jgi:putative endonuclease
LPSWQSKKQRYELENAWVEKRVSPLRALRSGRNDKFVRRVGAIVKDKKPEVFAGVCSMQLEKFFYVYMVADRSRVLYVGFSSDLYQRVLQHRKGRFEGFTSRYGCSRLVWFERFGGAQEAIAREKQIKRWRREKKVFLIEMENPTWEDLSAGWGLPIALD